MRLKSVADPTCSIAQALAVVGDPWSLLVVRDIAGGICRFDDLERELQVSRRTLSERIRWLLEGGVIEKHRYQSNPERFEYHLTAAGKGLLPALVALQDWGSRFVMGDGSLTATTGPTSAEARRVHDLVGSPMPALTLRDRQGAWRDPSPPGQWTVLYCFPGAFPPAAMGYPPGWGDIPGAAGCTLEATTYRDREADFARAGAVIHGVSTQRPDQLAAFAEHVALPFPLLSDEDNALAVALRLPTFRAAGIDRLKRLTLVVDGDRVIRSVLYPITDPAASVEEALRALAQARGSAA